MIKPGTELKVKDVPEKTILFSVTENGTIPALPGEKV